MPPSSARSGRPWPRRWRTAARGTAPSPIPGWVACAPEEVPEFFSGCFGMGSRDLQPADIIASVTNMLPEGDRRRQFYLGIDFIRRDKVHPKVQEWQTQIEKAYPGVGDLSLAAGEDVDLLPKGLPGRPHPLHRGVGRDHHGQEPHHDPLRSPGDVREVEPQVRVGEEGPAHHLLRGVRPRSRPAQLRAAPRGRGALPRSQRLPPFQRSRRSPRGRGPGHPAPGGPGGPVGAVSPPGPRSSSARRTFTCSISTGSESPRPRPTLPTSSTGCRERRSRVPSSRRRPSWSGRSLDEEEPVRHDQETAPEEVRSPGGQGGGGQLPGDPPRLR